MAGENAIIRFGAFELDRQTAILRKSGIRIKLQDQPLQILTALLENPGEIVTREELRRRLWPEGTFVDFDHSLNASVNKLREALGDTASNPRFVETVPRRGYRFIAPVIAPAQDVAAAPSVVREPEPRPSRALSGKQMMIAAVAATLVIAMAVLVATKRSASSPAHWTPHVVRLTSSPGLETQPSFSPDGNYVAYTGGPQGLLEIDIYVKQIGVDPARRLTSHPAADVSPRWSPDGRSIAFARFSGRGASSKFSVLVAPALGGPERPIGVGRIQQTLSLSTRLIDWFPDSERLVIADCGDGNAASLFGLDPRTGERWRLTSPPAGSQDGDPAVSPDGRRLAFTRTFAHSLADVYLLDLDDAHRAAGEPRPLSSGGGSVAPVWTPDGQEVLFASGAMHRKTLFRKRAAGSSPAEAVAIAAEGTWHRTAAISSRWQLAYAIGADTVDLFRAELRAGAPMPGMPFLSSTAVDHLAEYSPDGSRIAFVSNRSGVQQIWLADGAGENVQQLTFLSENKEATWPRWSPDARQIVFTVGRSAYVVSADGGQPAVLFRDVAAREAVADWSHDGEWIYFISNRSGRDELWKAPVDARRRDQAIQLTRNGGGPMRASPDRRFIYYAKGNNRSSELWRVGVEGGDESRVLDEIATSGAFAPTNEGVYFIPREDDSGSKLMLLDPRTLKSRPVGSLGGMPMWGLSISPDRRYILHSAATRAESDLMLVDNFR